MHQQKPGGERTVTNWHSQPATAQDQWVIEVSQGKRDGFFVEIGGYDGLRYSNTLALEESFGWTGLLVEADPDLFELARKNRPNCRHLCVAVAHYKGTSRFTRGGPWGGLTNFLPPAWKEEHGRRKSEEIHVNTTTLYGILDDRRVPEVIDYLSLDVEGIEVPVLREYFMSPNRVIRFLTVEYLEDAGTLMQLCRILEPHGYELVKTQGWDAFFQKID
jgi:FkbM family methyltransferase